jgi:hypothetical protein
MELHLLNLRPELDDLIKLILGSNTLQSTHPHPVGQSRLHREFLPVSQLEKIWRQGFWGLPLKPFI